ncbi:hypothetical protein ACFQZW_12990 [Lutibacter aestuarii]|uniref:Uncharacterized protein n=1 Tax=Lutibacter aestuarii TaxID=861111 RepID=A0ABW2ZCC5_9FLAO
MQKTPLQKANDKEYLKLATEFNLLKKLVTVKGFHNEWFNSLPKFKTREEAFDYLNETYYQLVGVQRYSSYKAFQNVNRKLRKNEM